MALNESVIYTLPQELVSRVGGLVILLRAVGGIIVLYLIFNIINAIINKKKRNELRKINENLEDIKKLLSKKK